jgi:hypothetical protein
VTVQNLESFEHLCELRLDALGEYLRSGGRTGHDQGRQGVTSQRLRKKKELHFERSYRATLEVVWAAWTDADQLLAWRSQYKPAWPSARSTYRSANASMSSPKLTRRRASQGTRWSMEGTFTRIDDHQRHLGG